MLQASRGSIVFFESYRKALLYLFTVLFLYRHNFYKRRESVRGGESKTESKNAFKIAVSQIIKLKCIFISVQSKCELQVWEHFLCKSNASPFPGSDPGDQITVLYPGCRSNIFTTSEQILTCSRLSSCTEKGFGAVFQMKLFRNKVFSLKRG